MKRVWVRATKLVILCCARKAFPQDGATCRRRADEHKSPVPSFFRVSRFDRGATHDPHTQPEETRYLVAISLDIHVNENGALSSDAARFFFQFSRTPFHVAFSLSKESESKIFDIFVHQFYYVQGGRSFFKSQMFCWTSKMKLGLNYWTLLLQSFIRFCLQ